MTKRQLQKEIETRIATGLLAPGDRLPPLRRLSEDYGITQSTARRALVELCDRQLLEMRRGDGTYVSRRRSVSGNGCTATVIAASDNHASSYCARALLGLQNIGAEAGWEFQILFANPENFQSCLANSRLRGKILILFGCYDSRPENQVPAGLPAVALEMHDNNKGNLSTVTLDPFAAAELADSYFQELALSKIVMVPVSSHPVHRIRAFAFRERRPDVQELSSSQLENIRPDTGYLFLSGSDYQNFACRLDLPVLPNILSVDGKHLENRSFRPVNTIAIDWEEAGKTVFYEARRRVAFPGCPAQRIYINPKLILAKENKQ